MAFKTIQDIDRTLTVLTGAERMIGYDATAGTNFKTTSLTDQKEKTAPGYRNLIIDGDFNHWGEGTSFSATGYTADAWYFQKRTTTATVTRQINIDSDVESYFLRMAVSANPAAAVQIEQKLKDISLLAGKNISVFVKLKSTTGATNFVVFIARNDGSSNNLTSGIIGSIPSDDTWAWYRVDITVPDTSGLTIIAGNHTGIFLQNATSETFTLDIDKVRVIETPANLAANDIPEWIKCNEDPEYTKQLVNKYFMYITGPANDSTVYPIPYGKAPIPDYCDFTIFVSTEMIQTPTFTTNFATSHINNVTTGAGIALSGAQTYSFIDISPDAVFFRVNDTGVFAINNTYMIFLRDDQNRYIKLDARY